MQKFVITTEGVLKFGDVQFHKDLLAFWEHECFGGGFWNVSENQKSVMLFGRSSDFGPADFEKVKSIDWSGIGGKPTLLFYYPNFPDLDLVYPIYVQDNL